MIISAMPVSVSLRLTEAARVRLAPASATAASVETTAVHRRAASGPLARLDASTMVTAASMATSDMVIVMVFVLPSSSDLPVAGSLFPVREPAGFPPAGTMSTPGPTGLENHGEAGGIPSGCRQETGQDRRYEVRADRGEDAGGWLAGHGGTARPPGVLLLHGGTRGP
jgi:hypothetical protein